MLALKSTDVLLFPEEGAEECPACHAKLVPTKQSVATGVIAVAIVAAACIVVFRMVMLSGFVPGFLAGLAAGILIPVLGILAWSGLVRFRATLDGRYTYDRRNGLGIL